MNRKYRSAIDRANEAIRRSRREGRLVRPDKRKLKAEPTFETLNCANAFAKNGRSLEHLFDRLF